MPGNPLPDSVWNRHANPKSGWSRLAVTPILVYALFTRRWRLLGATLLFVLVNPVLFPEPEEPPTEDFMYQVVRAEERWLDEERPLLGWGYPEVLNVASLVGSILAFWSAVRRDARGTVLGTVLLMAGKLGFVRALVTWNRATASDTE